MVIVRRVVAHPGNDGGPCPLLDRDALRPRHRAASHGRGEPRDDFGKTLGQIPVSLVERKEIQDGFLKVLLVFLLLLLAAFSHSFQFPLIQASPVQP